MPSHVRLSPARLGTPTALRGALLLAAMQAAGASAQSMMPSLLNGLLSGGASQLAAGAVSAATAPAPSADAAGEQAAPPVAVATPEQIDAALAASVVPLAAPDASFTGRAALKNKRYYVAEYRLLFEVGGSVSASTRAGYLPGRDYGATRMSVYYTWAAPDIATLQRITDRAYADFVARLQAGGRAPEPGDAFVQKYGAVYASTEAGTTAGTPVQAEVNGRKYLVFAPTGMRNVPRGFAGMGAGNIGKRIEWSHADTEGVSVTMTVNLAALESSGNGSSILQRGSSASASTAMHITSVLLQSHANGQAVFMAGGLAVPGQFGALRESGGYDTRKDGVVQALNMLGSMTMGLAGNNSKRVDMAMEVDSAALATLALSGMAGVNQAIVAHID